MAITKEQVLDALRTVQDPELKQDLVSLGFIKDIAIDKNRVALSIELTTPACPLREEIERQAHAAIMALEGVSQVDINMSSQVRQSRARDSGDMRMPNIKNIVPVASGKGGVGKSTVSVNLALALAGTGARVGIMDADVYGPSIPTILGVTSQPQVDRQNRVVPAEKSGLKIISMGFFMKPDEAVIWRGPMLHKAVQQFLEEVVWGEIDYLLVDVPPGTGDVQLSLCQLIPITGAVIVSTPQDVALNVAQKAITMFDKLNAPVLGIIENMSAYVCPHCKERDDIFGVGGARKTAERLKIPFLGEIPLDTSIRLASDAGKPIMLTDPDSRSAKAFKASAENFAAQVSIRGMQSTGAAESKVRS